MPVPSLAETSVGASGVPGAEPEGGGGRNSAPTAAPGHISLEGTAPRFSGGRGLISLDGPSGMYLYPTSATLPDRSWEVGYGLFAPDNSSDFFTHGFLVAYGVTDRIELGAVGEYADINTGLVNDSLLSAGPMARVALTENRQWNPWTPQTALGATARFGDGGRARTSAFFSLYKPFWLKEPGFLRSFGVHAGVRQVWYQDDVPLTDKDSQFNAYVGGELELPRDLFVVGEVSTKDSDVQHKTPYAVGIQWRRDAFAASLAAAQEGNQDDPGVYFGVRLGGESR